MSDQRDRAAEARERVMRTLREAAEEHPNPVERLQMGRGREDTGDLPEGPFRGE